jgi:hypothetical protein
LQLNADPLGGAKASDSRMTLFEYLAIAYSLVLSFAAMRIIEGLPDVFDAARRYWIHLVFVCAALMSCIADFWLFWNDRNAHWDFLLFLTVLANPGLLYFIACTLVPRDCDSIDSWRDYLFSVRIRYFSSVGAYFAAAAIHTTLLADLPLSSPLRLVEVTGLAVAIVGARARSERLLSVIAFFYIAFAAVGVLAFLRPGSPVPS